MIVGFFLKGGGSKPTNCTLAIGGIYGSWEWYYIVVDVIIASKQAGR